MGRGGNNYTGKRWLVLLLCLATLTCFSGAAFAESAASPQAERGVLDLRGRPFSSQDAIPLSGEWRFDWYAADAAEPAVTMIDVPNTWGGIVTEDGVKLSDLGRGVYRLTILHDPYDGMLAIRLPNISTSYTLSIDGAKVLSVGQAGADAASTRPYQLPQTVSFLGDKPSTELTLEVANFDHRQGGMRTDPVIGAGDRIQQLVFKRQSLEMIVFGALAMIGLYHLGLFALRRQEKSNLFFSLLCLFVACRMGVIGEGLFFRWLPALSWTAGTRLEYSAFALSGLFGFAYYRRMFPQEIARSWARAAAIVCALLLAYCWTVPVLTVSTTIFVYQAFVLLLSARTLAGLVLAGYRRREGARLALIGVAGFVATIVNDIFFYNGWGRSYDLVPFGLLLLIAMNSFSISLRFSRTFVRSERQSSELKEWNALLEERIAERTEELTRSYAELAESKRGLERMELSRRQLVSNISHDLRTPMTLLQGYLEAIRDGVIEDREKLDATVRLMLTKVEGLNGLIRDLFELSLLEARRAPMTFAEVRLGDWLTRLAGEYGPDLRREGFRFAADGEDEDMEHAYVRIDERRMDRVLANLIYNAMKHTPKGGRIALSVAADTAGGTARVEVADTGSGIRPEDLPHIFERFYQNGQARQSSSGGSGLGLAIAKEIVEMHGGRLTAKSAEGGGSVFSIELPLADEEEKSAIEALTRFPAETSPA